jgi:hypothetical protein
MKLSFFVAILLFISMSPNAEVTQVQQTAQIHAYDKQQFHTLHDRLIQQTYKDPSPFAQMGRFPCPSLLIYSPLQQRFVSEEEKFNLLKLATAEGRVPLTKVPVLIGNRPVGHPYFKHLSHQQLQQVLPEADLSRSFIAIYCSQTERSARSTEKLLAAFVREGSPDHQLIAVPALIRHLDKQVLTQPDWQVIMYRAED